MEVKTLFEDDFCLIVNKPNNVLIHKSYYARNIKGPTLLELLKNKYSNLHPIHRLDYKTSGVLLLSKGKVSISDFQKLFSENKIQKTYFAVVRGFPNKKGIIDSPIKNADTGIIKPAKTAYETLENIELDIAVHPYPTSRYSLIKLIPKTGRMHQLRKHMNKNSTPIVGDYKYGDRFHNRNFENNFNWHNMFLHAYSLEFIHPKTNEVLNIKANFPASWMDLGEKFAWNLEM